MITSYLKVGWRNLLRNTAYSFINISGLAMGMTIAMFIGFWIYDELSFNKYHTNYDTSPSFGTAQKTRPPRKLVARWPCNIQWHRRSRTIIRSISNT